MRPDRSKRRWTAGLIALLAASSPRGAGSQEAPAATIAGEPLVVQLVEVDLWAFDADDRPVTDLRRDELVLREDGVERLIEQFERWRAEAAAPRAAATRSETGAEALSEPPSRLDTAPTIAIFFDDTTLDSGRRERIARSLADWIGRELPRESEVMLALHDTEIRIAVPRTRDHRRARAMLTSLPYNRPTAVASEMDERETLARIVERQRLAIENPMELPCPTELLRIADDHADLVELAVRQSLWALAEFAESLAAVPGRKLVVWVAGEVPSRAGGAAYDLVRALCDGSGAREQMQWAVDMGAGAPGQIPPGALAMAGENRQLAPLVEAVSARANASGATVWTYSASGLVATGTGATSFSRTTTMGTQARQRAEASDVHHALAAETGGRALLDANDAGDALEALAVDLASGYTLAYPSPRGRPGQVHRIEVTTSRPGVRLRHRRSWRESSGEESLAAQVRSAAALGVARPGFGATLTRLANADSTRGGRAVVRLELPMSRIALSPRASGRLEGALQLAVALAGGPATGTVRSRRLEVTVAAGDALAGSPRVVHDVDVPLAAQGPTTVVVGLRDEATGETALLRLELAAE